jgi:hypothetical protein
MSTKHTPGRRMKKAHIGNHGTPKCVRGMSAHRAGRVRPSITVSLDEFQKLPRERQCERCAKSIDTTDFARGLGALVFGAKATGSAS